MCRNHHVGSLCGLLPLCTGSLGIALRLVGLLQGFRCLHLLCGYRKSRSLSLFLPSDRIGIGNRNLRVVLSLDCLGIGVGCADTGIPLGLGDADVLVPVGFGFSDFTETVLLGDALLGIVDSLCRSLLTESLDIA